MKLFNIFKRKKKKYTWYKISDTMIFYNIGKLRNTYLGYMVSSEIPVYADDHKSKLKGAKEASDELILKVLSDYAMKKGFDEDFYVITELRDLYRFLDIEDCFIYQKFSNTLYFKGMMIFNDGLWLDFLYNNK